MRSYLAARLVLISGLLGGCTSWQAPNVAPDQLAKSYDGQRIRVTRNDGSQVVLADARVTPTGVSGQWDRTSVVIPTTEIQQLAVRGKSPGRTIALAFGLFGAAGIAGALAVGGGETGSDLR